MLNVTCGFVSENQRRYAAGVMSVVSVHVRAADAHRFDPYERVVGSRFGQLFGAENDFVGPRID